MPQQNSFSNKYRDLISNFPDKVAPIRKGEIDLNNYKKVREQYQSIYCEFCSGSGGHLIERARQVPNSLFVAFELRYKRVVRTVEKAQDLGVNNIFIIQADAKNCLGFFEKESLSGIYLNFPDPWEKARWKKHRLVSHDWLLQIHSLLKFDGFFAFKSDHAEYFSEVVKNLENLKQFKIEQLSYDLYKSPFLEQNVATEFENMFIFKGLPIHYILAKKLGS